jgi:YfiH family protein
MTPPLLREVSHDELTWLAADGPGWHVVFSTRLGGISQGAFGSLNLGLLVGDDRGRVIANRSRLLDALDLRLDDLVVPAQVHGTRVRRVGDGERGRGARDAGDAIVGTDVLATAAVRAALLVSVADCVPVLLVAETAAGRPALALAHAGWRGLLAGVLTAAAAAATELGKLTAAVVGPSIGPCCFAVDDALHARFEARFAGSAGDGTVDLWTCARQELEAAGVPPAAVTVSGLCTSCDLRFFSHRRDHGLTGRHLAIAWRHGR